MARRRKPRGNPCSACREYQQHKSVVECYHKEVDLCGQPLSDDYDALKCRWPKFIDKASWKKYAVCKRHAELAGEIVQDFESAPETAAVFVVTFEPVYRELWLVQDKPNRPGREPIWKNPGGGHDPAPPPDGAGDLSYEDTAYREVWEETGFEIGPLVLLYEEKVNPKHTKVFYAAEVARDQEPEPGDEILKIEKFVVDETLDLSFPILNYHRQAIVEFKEKRPYWEEWVAMAAPLNIA